MIIRFVEVLAGIVMTISGITAAILAKKGNNFQKHFLTFGIASLVICIAGFAEVFLKKSNGLLAWWGVIIVFGGMSAASLITFVRMRYDSKKESKT